MNDIRLIALDLDGTLLNSNKELTARNEAALRAAAEKGIYIVPTTGRFFTAMPAVIRELPYLRYAITINGAAVYDIAAQQDIVRAELPLSQALAIMEYLDTLPVFYDCYMDNRGWMTKALQDQAADYAPDVHYLNMIRNLRTPVPELKAFIRERGMDIQKIQFFMTDMELRARLLKELPERFENLSVSSSVVNNIEINSFHANKGEAVLALAKHLGLSREQTMAFGDGLNDLSMIEASGVGVAMANAVPTVLAAADRVTLSCDEDGVAALIEELCL